MNKTFKKLSLENKIKLRNMKRRKTFKDNDIRKIQAFLQLGLSFKNSLERLKIEKLNKK
tara:strand:+ start:604 stop:780 length:177 start_codon:yes stop_codon:yes gene_type:complete